MPDDTRVPILYIAPWVDLGGTDKGTIDWFRAIDRDRFAPSLITTQPSPNRRLEEVRSYAEEIWPLPDLMPGAEFPRFILDFVHTRGARIVHAMNARLAFDLLPDLRALSAPPATVVQLHVEEEDRSGYVRYVTTRYGNLVDAFSISSEQLARVVRDDYQMPGGKVHIIHTGVDGEVEFSPARVQPAPGVDAGVFNILYPVRLVAQKDPMLMLEVAARLRERGAPFRIHSIGDGNQLEEVRAATARRGLDDVITLHGAVDDPAPWFAACDAVLLTSRFEGIPFVLFEALAMATPVVAPDLPGVAELLAGGGGGLVTPRDDAGAYVEALSRLASDSSLREQVGARGRERALSGFSLEHMAAAHEALYEDLLARAGGADAEPVPAAPLAPAALELAPRPRGERPRVSVLVPCFDDGRYLPQCIESIRTQTYPDVEIVVVDDGSSDPGTLAVLDGLERDEVAKVIRLTSNRGPGAARNAALGECSGRYVLPVDADNLLLPDAIAKLVEQLTGCDETIGYVYPNLQYFGNRRDYHEVPAFNLYELMRGNYCDTCSLVDAGVFDAGVRYVEEPRLGHEDWDLVLELAARGVYGVPARGKTFLFRKYGFTRSDTVQYASKAFDETLAARHPALYGRIADIKPRWSPALSIVGLAAVAAGAEQQELAARVRRQTCPDAEVLVRSEDEWPDEGVGPHVRRVPLGPEPPAADAAAAGIEVARGRFMLVTAGTASELLQDPAFVEKMIRTLGANPDAGAVAFTDAGPAGRHALRTLSSDDDVLRRAHTVLWRVDPSRALRAAVGADPVGDLAAALADGVEVQWRHLPAPESRAVAPRATDSVRVGLDGTRPQRPAERAERRRRLSAPPLIGTAPAQAARRLAAAPAWLPPETEVLSRWVDRESGVRLVSPARDLPARAARERDIGAIQRFPVPGTARLERIDGADGPAYVATPIEEVDFDERPAGKVLGYLEAGPLPLLDPVQVGTEPGTGHQVLVCGRRDPLAGKVDIAATLGWIEAVPLNPQPAARRGPR